MRVININFSLSENADATQRMLFYQFSECFSPDPGPGSRDFTGSLSGNSWEVDWILSDKRTGDCHELNGVSSHVARSIGYLGNDLYDWFIPNDDEIYQ